jgi:hypothetical protein
MLVLLKFGTVITIAGRQRCSTLLETCSGTTLRKEAKMIDKAQLCEKITEIYPDIGRCGIDIDVDFDRQQDRWVVDLKKDRHHLRTFLEDGDAELCLMGRQCVGLGVEINQLRDSIERYPGA